MEEGKLMMTEYEKLVLAEQTCHTIEIKEKATGKEGVANTSEKGIEVQKTEAMTRPWTSKLSTAILKSQGR